MIVCTAWSILMSKAGKRALENAGKFDAVKRYSVEEALTLLKSFKSAKFDESIDVALRLGVDPKKSDQMVRGVASMPHGTGKKTIILVFAKGEKADEARAAGADIVGADEIIEKIKGGWLEFDKAIATPDMMPKIGQIAKILGPRGLMPNPKVGTVTQDVTRAVREEKAGRVEFRAEKAGIVHVAIGKVSFSVKGLEENFSVLLDQVMKLKPQTAKGTYVQGITISSTMGPGLKIDLGSMASAGAKG